MYISCRLMHRMINLQIRSLSIVVLLKKYKRLRNNERFLIYILTRRATYHEGDKVSFHPKNRVSRTIILLRTLIRVILIFLRVIYIYLI